MKIKPLYIYLGVFLIAVVSIFVFTNLNDDKQQTAMTGQMPNDDVHKGLNQQNPHGGDMGAMTERVNHALAQMRKQYQENPNDTSIAKQFADYLSMAHQPDSAIIIYENILVRDGKRSDIRNSVAYLYLLKRDFKKSEAALSGILRYDQNDTQAKFNMGIIAVESGDKEKAKSIWQDLVKQHPGDPMAKKAEEAIVQVNQN